MALSTGTVLAGRYEITSPIATGGMGEVWRARDRVLDREVAAKVLRSEFTGDPSFVARFRNEARHTAALSHPNIASVYDYGEADDERNPGQRLAFLVMELVEGQPLVTILHEEGRLPVDWTLHVLGQSADGLSAAHAAGVVHRDIKPGNLIVRPDGVVKLTDFGIARARDATPLTRTGMVVGTAQYLSPEQAQGFEVTSASDVYSLGVVGYECLTGSRPFDGTSQVAIALAHINRPPPPLPGDVPRAVRQLLERALQKDPGDRFTDGAAFAAAIRAVAAAVGDGLPPGTGVAAAAAATQVVDMPEDATAGHPAGGDEPTTQVLDAAPVAAAGATGAHTAARPMPPLQGPPTGSDAWDGDAPDGAPAGRGRRRLWLLAALALVAVLAGLAWILFGGEDAGGGGTTARTSAPASAPDTGPASAAQLAFDPAALLGRDADEVAAELEARGFTAVAREDASADQLAGYGAALAAGEVAAVAPAGGRLAADTPITLYVAAEGYAPPAPGTGGGGGETGGGGAEEGGGAPPATSAAPTPSSPAPPPPTTTVPTTATTPTTPTTPTAPTSPTTQPGTTLPPPPASEEPPPGDAGAAGSPVAQGAAG
ncbi:serine/threonine-protein kinase [Trujillonella humicola]|uniref:serine/threonine-protein kinase n=1 Tax=Trujillonella humicola TaxID=3383699 RepID=UPI0039063946